MHKETIEDLTVEERDLLEIVAKHMGISSDAAARIFVKEKLAEEIANMPSNKKSKLRSVK